MSDLSPVTSAFITDHPGEAAAILEGRPLPEASAFLRGAPASVAALLLRWMAPTPGAACFQDLGTELAADVAEDLPLETVAGFLRRGSPEDAEALLDALPKGRATALRRLLRYPEGSAGALIDPAILSLPRDINIGEAIRRLRETPRHAIYYVYLVDRDDRLVGVVNLRELLLAPADAPIASVMQASVACLPARASARSIIEHPGWRMYHALPVVDERKIFLGAIRYETMRDLENKDEVPRAARNGAATAASLGDLVWVALAGLFTGITGGSRPAGGDPPEPGGVG